MNNEVENIAGTFTIESEITEEVTFVINGVFNSFEEAMKQKRQFNYGGGIHE